MPRRNDEEQQGLDLTAEEITLSCFRAYHFALGAADVDFDTLSADEQDRWHRTICLATMWLPTMEGATFQECCQRIIGDWSQSDDILEMQQSPYMREWEVVLRHLNVLLDSDEIGSVEDLERSWKDWTPKRKVIGG